uniref:Fatty acid desaturase n=1 Tax=Mesocestoides corti TaxID=53468 RepID=A0A5K3FS60_MESCO
MEHLIRLFGIKTPHWLQPSRIDWWTILPNHIVHEAGLILYVCSST